MGEHERVFRCTIGGVPVRLAPGTHMAIPLLQRVQRVPGGPLRAASSIKVRSTEGIDIEIPFAVEAQLDDSSLAALLGAPSLAGSPEAVISRAVSEVIAGWSGHATAESLALLEGRKDLEEKVRSRLEGQGFTSVVTRLELPRGGPGAIAAITSRALRDRMADTKIKIAILGLDAADWEIIDPLMAKGQLPNLARLKSRGAWGNIKTMTPALSPLLWTSVATGKPPEEHGIIDFLVKDSKTGREVPVPSRWRKVKALWNIFSDAGRSSAFIAWWATWPAEPVNGWMVSDRVAYSLFGFVPDRSEREGATYPEGYFHEIRPKLVDDSAITLDEIKRFADVSPAELTALRQQVKDDPKAAYHEPVNHLGKVLASAQSYQAIALDILARGQPDLFSIYYEGIDEVCHRFAHYMPPKMDMVTAEEYAKYRDTVFAYYRYQDRLVGEILRRLSPDTVVFVLSDHGFQNGSSRPTKEPPYIEGKPGLWHRRYGILIVAGPAIKPGRLDTTSLLDIAPTVLYLSGLPVAADMQGHVLKEAIDDAFLAGYPVRTLPSYEAVGRPLAEIRPAVAASGVDEEVIARLRSLGYVGGGQEGGPGRDGSPPAEGIADAGGGPGLNEAGLYLKNKDYARAQRAVAEALKISPNLVSALLLEIEIEQARKHYDRAIEMARQFIAKHRVDERAIYLELGRIYEDGGRARDGIAYFQQLASEQPEVPEIRAALGALLLKGGQESAAEKELLEALRLNPALSEPLADLHLIYQDSPRVLTLEPIVRKGLEIDGKSIVHLNWLGLIEQWKKNMPQAEAAFRKAMELDPDYASTMANLGAFYGRSGRLQEAVDILSRAVVKDPDNVESWVNLGAAQGRLGRSREAIQALETARSKGVRTTTLFNALALAYLQDHQRDKAMQYLKESLAIDPNQKDANDLLKAVSRRS
ncbi:MAG: hypothetical protein AUH92_00565 [Acidobacteria bacterium 13_1_40CM_4_69_4]|nr:MAG: hypothetical protein AUH92_00565 [Acidobacteria bacterium 13_1_40CM_4_69_4]